MANSADDVKFSLIKVLWFRLSRPVAVFILLLATDVALPYIPMPESTRYIVDKTVNILLIIAFAGILIAFIRVAQDYVYHHYDLRKSDNLRERKIRTQLQFLRKLLVAIIITLTVCAILLSFNSLRRIGTGLLTGVGVGGIIIGFAAQRSLGNLLAGFQIAFTQPLRIDDALVVEGEFGRVEEITLTYVVLNLWDQRRLILPINYFIEKPFQNWTRTTAELLGSVIIYLDYNAPMEPIRQEFNRLLQETDLWDKRVSVIQMTDANENSVEIRALVSADSSGRAFDLRCYIRENLIAFIQKNYPESLPKTRTELTGNGQGAAFATRQPSA